MKTIFYSVLLLLSLQGYTQKNKQLSVAFTNGSTSNPFSKFGSLVTGIEQPGVEFGYAFNWKTKSKHDWYQEIKLAYFYHRFVQHAIPLYTDFGYRYKFSQKWAAQVAIGAGYLHSIPATAQLKLDDNGVYKNGKSVGRMQALAAVNFGLSHTFNSEGSKPLSIFVTYQQMLQTPFINSYVPLLPYNSLLLGISIPLTQRK